MRSILSKERESIMRMLDTLFLLRMEETLVK